MVVRLWLCTGRDVLFVLALMHFWPLHPSIWNKSTPHYWCATLNEQPSYKETMNSIHFSNYWSIKTRMCVPLLNKLNLISVLRIRMDPKKITLISDPDPYYFKNFISHSSWKKWKNLLMYILLKYLKVRIRINKVLVVRIRLFRNWLDPVPHFTFHEEINRIRICILKMRLHNPDQILRIR